MEELLKLFCRYAGQEPQSAEPLPRAGSDRQYIRLNGADGGSLVGVVGSNLGENRAFCYLAGHFAEKGLPVPRVVAVGGDGSCYLQTDLGRLSLYDALAGGRSRGAYDETEKDLLRSAMRMLPHVQLRGAEGLDEGRLLRPARFDRQAAMFDLNYFKYCFLRTMPMGCDEVALEADFCQLAGDIAAAGGERRAFLIRDFQARNVMLAEGGKPYLIDFQGGRIGPLHYDVASFLWQASARYPEDLREELTDVYLDELGRLEGTVDAGKFRSELRLFVLLRTLQVLGAYGFRGYFEQKAYFLSSIPQAVGNLRELLDGGVCARYPYLEGLLREMCSLPKVCECKQMAEHKHLIVRIFSFSYKNGIPADVSGNGGGYVFDCRSTHNPGRYAPYKRLTGLDGEVKRFLEDDGEILRFLDHVCPIAEAHVQRYIERGFTDLMFSFGCTGGQHRSVYSAQHLAEHLHRKFGVEIRLEHREQGIRQHFPAIKRP
ncbi:MAG: phosphotransferase [Prevotellaceae bacterium]|nr:phosphotransferase [Prevotellaceae bacterium]